MSNADFDTRNTSPGTRPTTAKPAENGRKHRPSAARSAHTPGNRPAGHAQHHHPPPPATAQNPRIYGRFTVSSARPTGPFKRAAPVCRFDGKAVVAGLAVGSDEIHASRRRRRRRTATRPQLFHRESEPDACSAGSEHQRADVVALAEPSKSGKICKQQPVPFAVERARSRRRAGRRPSFLSLARDRNRLAL